MEIDLTGQVALVVARDGPVAEAVRAALAANGASVLVGDPAADSPHGVVTEALKASGRLDILVFISPTFGGRPGAIPKRAMRPEPSLEGWSRRPTTMLSPHRMRSLRHGGRIVVIGSALGLLPARRHPLRRTDRRGPVPACARPGDAARPPWSEDQRAGTRRNQRRSGRRPFCGRRGRVPVSHGATATGHAAGSRGSYAVPGRSREQLHDRSHPARRRRPDCRLCPGFLKPAALRKVERAIGIERA